VHAIRYATIRDFPVWALVAGADTTRTIDIAMMFWLLRNDERTVLVDAGFYRDKFVQNWKPANFVRPSAALSAFGVAPESVTDVIVTHVHWDHLDGADLFPNARVWLQREEFDYYVSPRGEALRGAIDSLDAGMLVALEQAGRLRLLDGDSVEVLPGITAYTGGKHTYASQYIGVKLSGATAVLASDNVYLYENLELGVPIQQTLDPRANLAAQARMRRIASSERLIVPGHDPAVFERFAVVGKRAVKVE
jgi:glyoxylase-like metal-dependent hydrolase (beta-lactamase superfamily II)